MPRTVEELRAMPEAGVITVAVKQQPTETPVPPTPSSTTHYQRSNQALVKWLSFVASVTLLVAPASYDVGHRKHAEKSLLAIFTEG
jgi:hypothetical protein